MKTTLRFTSVALIVSFALLCGMTAVFATPYEIQFKSGSITPPANEFDIPQANLDDESQTVHVLLQLEDYLQRGTSARLDAVGVKLLTYLPDRAYIASVPSDLNGSRLSALGVRAITPVYPEYKLHPRVTEQRFGEWSLLDSGERIFAVEIMSDVSLENAAKGLFQSGNLIGARINAAHTLLVACDENEAYKIANHDFVPLPG